MKNTLIRLLLIGCLSVALCSRLSALTFGDARSIGFVVDGVGSPETEASYINILINPTLVPLGSTDLQVPAGTGEFYTRTNTDFGALPNASDTSFNKQDNSNTSFDLGLGGYTYLIGKYDAGNAGMYVWYVSGLTGTVTLPSTFQDRGLSHTIAYAAEGEAPPPRVPDNGSTVALLGAALVVVAGIGRRVGFMGII